MNELTIDLDLPIVSVLEWNAELGDCCTRPVPPVMLFLASEISQCLQHGRTTFPHGTLAATQTGYVTATLDGRDYVYEIHPARFNDAMPYTPPVYVGRWPD